ncbi:MAG: GNAT family N-acyltransferase [Candidatus Sedimenticola sp. (ex Thyasira tokunagai)]
MFDKCIDNREEEVQLDAGNYEVRLACSASEVEAAQRLRYRVFYEEMGAQPSPSVYALKRDVDGYDAYCDHLLVIDKGKSNGEPCVVGTYRLLRRKVAQDFSGFYSEQEFDLGPLLSYPGEIVEMGRSCVASNVRTGAVMQYLWRGIAEYIEQHDVSLLFGCASFHGTEPQVITRSLSYLYHNYLAPEALRPRALDKHYVDMNPDVVDISTVGLKDISLPPLIKGYLRVGSFVGDGAVIDHQFNTTDICVVLDTDLISRKYQRHFQ